MRVRHRLHAVLLGFAILALGAGLVWQPRQAPAAQYNAGLASTYATYVNRGQALAGLGPDVGILWDDFTLEDSNAALTGWIEQLSGTGAIVTNVAGSSGGSAQFSSGATASSFSAANSSAAMFGNRRTTRWYVATRFAVTTAIDAQTKASFGVYDLPQVSPSNLCGVFGTAFSGSNTNFLCQFDGDRAGSYIDTLVPIDTAFHVYEQYCLGDNVYRIRVDGGTEKSATMTVASATSANAFFWTQNGTTAAARTIVVDWVLVMGAKP